MDFEGIYDRLRAIDAPGLVDVDRPREPNKEKKDKGRFGEPYVVVDPKRIDSFLFACRDDERLRFELLVDLTGTDPAADDENLWINIHLLSVANKHRLAIKCLLPKENAVLPSAVPVYRAAQWHEREAGEMYGITFTGNPDPRNILLPDDWVGYPLRKDYEFPKEYHGISCE
ncbi:MAG: NADH-quinone oxidoreductase subunit C [Planctomycetota bacterium]